MSWKPDLFQIIKKTKDTSDVFTLELKPLNKNGAQNIDAQNSSLDYSPGQFNMLYAHGLGEVAISISGAPKKNSITHTIRRVGQVTQALEKMKVGDVLGLRGPYGKPWPVDQCLGKDVIIMAGGIGLAPLTPLIEWIIANREKMDNVKLLHGCRTPDDILFKKEFSRWKKNGIDIHITVDRLATPKQKYKGNIGVITTLIDQIEINPESVAFLCGPEIMMQYSAEALQNQGLQASNVYVTLERHMKCAMKMCGRCQIRELFVCGDGPVFPYSMVEHHIKAREL